MGPTRDSAQIVLFAQLCTLVSEKSLLGVVRPRHRRRYAPPPAWKAKYKPRPYPVMGRERLCGTELLACRDLAFLVSNRIGR